MADARFDAIDWNWRGRAIKLIDTAGLRRKAKRADALEHLSSVDAMRAIQFAEIVILLIDAATVQDFGQGIEKQDLQLASHVEAEGRGLVVAINKYLFEILEAAPARQDSLAPLGAVRDLRWWTILGARLQNHEN